jgi:hypothetical protein
MTDKPKLLLESDNLEMCAVDIARRVAQALHPFDFNHESETSHTPTREAWARRVATAVQDGTLRALDPTTRLAFELKPPLTWGDALVPEDELRAFLAPHGIEVSVVPVFKMPVRPTSVPIDLQNLPASTRIIVHTDCGGLKGTGTSTAGEYLAELTQVMERQRAGKFIVLEAVQLLADARPGTSVEGWTKRIAEAFAAGVLQVHSHEDGLPIAAGEQYRKFADIVFTDYIDSWLHNGRAEGFPPESVAVAVHPSVSPASAIETPKQRRARLLQMHDAEVSAGRKRGALARITEIEKRTRPTADRSNIGKDVKKARNERDAERRSGALTRLLS